MLDIAVDLLKCASISVARIGSLTWVDKLWFHITSRQGLKPALMSKPMSKSHVSLIEGGGWGRIRWAF
jgi:hypothetical protein